MAHVTSRGIQRLHHNMEKAIDATPVESLTPCIFEILQTFINESAHFSKEGNWYTAWECHLSAQIYKFEYQMSKIYC